VHCTLSHLLRSRFQDRECRGASLNQDEREVTMQATSQTPPPDHTRARFAATAAAAACVHEGGADLVLAAELMGLVGFGWDAEEHDLHQVQKLLTPLGAVDGNLPHLMLGALRDNASAELVLTATGMIPRHAIFLGNALGPATRLRRLVIAHAYVGDEGASAIAEGISRLSDGQLEEVQIAYAFVGNRGAAALATAVTAPASRCLTHWSLDGNVIGDDGAEELVTAAEKHTTEFERFTLSGNSLSETAAERYRCRLACVAKFAGTRPKTRPQPPTPCETHRLNMIKLVDVARDFATP
jgi:hypothetical protein